MKSQVRNNYVQTGGFGVVSKNERLNNFHTEKALFKIGDNVLKFKNKKVVLKIDTEDHEEFVIKGLKKILNKNKILLQIEIYDQNFFKIDKLLKKFKFMSLNSIKSDGKIDYYYKNY
ncbi:FkbM family methyltransferase [Candidatus Pelagibacter sp.]|nr:FkbM family methyltransferase [Candidatus Pelagibacter sp.]